MAILITVGCAFCFTGSAGAQSLDEQLDERQYLKGLVELGLRDVLEHYIQTHPTDDPVLRTQYQIAAERMRLREPGLSGDERRQIVQRILEIRRQLIDQHSDDVRLAIWLADQAQDLMFELLPIDGTGLHALFGMPSSEQLQRARDIAARMNRLTALAELEIDQAIRAIESSPGYTEDVAEQIRRRRLAREQRDLRIPFLRGVAAFLHAELNVKHAAERDELYDIAGASLERVVNELHGDLKSRAHAYLGLSALRLGQLQQAREWFDTIDSTPDANLTDRFMAEVGRAQIDEARHDLRSALDQLSALTARYSDSERLFFRLLIADQQFRLRRELAEQSAGSRRERRMIEAFESYTSLLDENLGIESKRKLDLVLTRLKRVVNDESSLNDPPPIVDVARAAHFADQLGDVSQAVTILEQVLNHDDLDVNTRSAARMQLAETYRAAGQPLAAAAQMIALARENASARDAADWLRDAAALAWSAYEVEPSHEAGQKLDEAVTMLLESHHSRLNDLGRWQYLAGRLALDRNDVDDALSYFNSIGSTSNRWADAQFMLASAHRQLMNRSESPAERQDRARSLQRVVTQARSALEQQYTTLSDPSRVESIQYYLDYLEVFEAEALIRLHEPERALELLQKLESRTRTTPALKAASLRARLEAHQAIGSVEQAVDDVRTLLAESPGQAPQVVSTMLDALCARVRRLQSTGQVDAAQDVVTGTLAPLAVSVHSWLGNRPSSSEDLQHVRRATAEALRFAGEHEKALGLYEELLREHPNAAGLLVGKADCLYGLGGEQRLGEAMLIFRRVAQAGADIGAEQYWLSQLRMLQILDNVKRNTDQILPRIQRLRREDETLGGPWYQRQFEQLQLKYAGGP